MQAKESQVYVYTNDGVNLYYTDFIGHIDTNDIDHTLHWKKYALMKADANLYMGGIVSKLEALKLNETEIRFCLLTMLDLPLKQIANTINYSSAGIKTLKKRISIKLSTTPQNLRIFLFSMATTT